MAGLCLVKGHRDSPFSVIMELWVLITKVHQTVLSLVTSKMLHMLQGPVYTMLPP